MREWYQASSCRWVSAASGRLDGVDLGALTRLEPLGVGFSEPPRRPSIVRLRTLMDWPEDSPLPGPKGGGG